MQKTPLSILEFGYMKPPHLFAHQTMNSLFEEVAIYDTLGYKRLWLGEHYSTEFSWYSPEILLPLLLGYSEKIKIGWSGVLLNYHNPLLVANNMRLLSAMFDGRVDLGVVAAGVGAREIIKKILKRSPLSWAEQIEQLSNLVRGKFVEGDEELLVPPHGTDSPSLWYLSTSSHTIPIAVENKMNYAITFTHQGSNFSDNIDTLKRFKEAYFKKNGTLPETSVLIGAACTDEPRIASLFEKKFAVKGFSNLFGSAEYISQELIRLKKQLGNDEFCLYNPYCIRERRLDSYSKLIKCFHEIDF